MKKVILLVITGIICTVFSFGQNKVLLENGNSVVYSNISIENDRVKVMVNGEMQYLYKTDILCIIPEKGKSYTFRKTNNIKMKIAGKGIKNDYQGSDIPRLFAYKYYKSGTDASELYKLFQDTELTQVDFEGYYKTEQQRLRRGATTGTIIGVVIVAISVGGLIRTLKTANDLSYNHIYCPGINSLRVNNNPIWLSNHRYYRLKYCA